MTTSQVTILLVDVALIILLARLFGWLFRRIGQPAVIGEMLVGILLGPTLFGGAIGEVMFPDSVRPFLQALANIGMAVFMFMIGMEMDRKVLRGEARSTLSVALGSIVLPFGLGALLAVHLIPWQNPDHEVGFVLFMGAAMAVTAFPVLARILVDRGMQGTRVGRMALSCAAMADIIAWALLAVVVTISSGTDDGLQRLWLVAPYAAAMIWVVAPRLRRLLAPGTPLTAGRIGAVLAGMLLSAAFTEWIGLHFIFGAFAFGVAMPHEGTDRLRQDLLDRVGGVSSVMLLPVFFVVAGLRVDLSTMDLTALGILGLIVLVAVTGKFVGAFLGARLNGLPAQESSAVAVLMNTRGLTELVVLSIGLQMGVLDERLYTLMVLMALLTTAMAGPLLHLCYRSKQELDSPLGRGR